ncbi:hypothetical protein ABEO75_24245 [Paenibacillus macerans]|uniref:hypothetical protein n=1 Tax=Paenibacillus macerans TaxID=44252 RepID=UPI002E204F53|nr:hypothetical protein [Paenibacillus macerans]
MAENWTQPGNRYWQLAVGTTNRRLAGIANCRLLEQQTVSSTAEPFKIAALNVLIIRSQACSSSLAAFFVLIFL